MSEHFENKELEKTNLSKPVAVHRDEQLTLEGTEVEEEVFKCGKTGITTIEAQTPAEQSPEAKEIERRLKELGKEIAENRMCIIAGLLLKKEASLFFKIVNLLKLIDVIFVFCLTMTPVMALALVNFVVNLLLYYKNCNAISIPTSQVLIAICVLVSSLIVLAEELKSDYRRLSTSEFMPLFLPFLGLWIIQTVVWAIQMIVLLHSYRKCSANEASEPKKVELETSNVQNSHLMVSQNASRLDQEAELSHPANVLSVVQSSDKVPTGDESLSSERSGTKKLKKRNKESKV